MPAIPPTTFDGAKLLDRLNADKEVAFIVSLGDKKWKAASSLERFEPGKMALWHVPSGIPPLRSKTGPVAVLDPFAGWLDPIDWTALETTFGGVDVDHPNIVIMDIRFHERLAPPLLLADFSWIGGHYSVIGKEPHASTTRWWRRFARWFEKAAQSFDIV